MMNINVNQLSLNTNKNTLEQTKKDGETTTVATTQSTSLEEISIATVYEPTEKADIKKATYTVDFAKIQEMKDDTDSRMLQLFQDTARETGLKQLGGVKGILDKLRNGEKVTLEIEYSAEDVQQAQIDVAEGGYWSAEKTSDRLVDFAKALSGGDPEKVALLKDSFVKAFKEIEEMFGGELPELSYNTYDLTMEKFDAWAEE